VSLSRVSPLSPSLIFLSTVLISKPPCRKNVTLTGTLQLFLSSSPTLIPNRIRDCQTGGCQYGTSFFSSFLPILSRIPKIITLSCMERESTPRKGTLFFGGRESLSSLISRLPPHKEQILRRCTLSPFSLTNISDGVSLRWLVDGGFFCLLRRDRI